MDIRIVCIINQKELPTQLPLDPEQLDFLLGLSGMFRSGFSGSCPDTTSYQVQNLFTLTTVLRSHVGRKPWLQALIDVLDTDPHYERAWKLRVSTQELESDLDSLFGEGSFETSPFGGETSDGDSRTTKVEIRLTEVVGEILLTDVVHPAERRLVERLEGSDCKRFRFTEEEIEAGLANIGV